MQPSREKEQTGLVKPMSYRTNRHLQRREQDRGIFRKILRQRARRSDDVSYNAPGVRRENRRPGGLQRRDGFVNTAGFQILDLAALDYEVLKRFGYCNDVIDIDANGRYQFIRRHFQTEIHMTFNQSAALVGIALLIQEQRSPRA